MKYSKQLAYTFLEKLSTATVNAIVIAAVLQKQGIALKEDFGSFPVAMACIALFLMAALAKLGPPFEDKSDSSQEKDYEHN